MDRRSAIPLGLCTLAVATLGACAPPAGDRGGESDAGGGPDVQVYGALRDLMHGGDTTAVARLDSLTPDPQLVALGALSGLRGELTVLDGQVLVAYPVSTNESRTTAGSSSAEGAALLVAARVPAWQTLRLDEAVSSDALDGVIEDAARRAGIDVERPFPFVIEGEVRSLEWHVIDGARLTPGQVAHQGASVIHRMLSDGATLVGFYSKHHEGVFTHMGSRTHVHAWVTAPLSSGHVDHVELAAGATLKLPARP